MGEAETGKEDLLQRRKTWNTSKSKIKEQIRLKKMMSVEKEPAPKSKKHERKEEPKERRQEKKPRTEPKEEPKDEEEEEEEAPDYSAPDDATREVRAKSRDETSGSESVSENIKAQIKKDLESSDDEKRQGRYRTGGVHLRSRSPARDDRQPNSPEGQPAWKREEHRYYKDWRGGKGKSKSNTKEKGRGKSKSVQSGHWEWHPNNKLTPKEISAILMHHAKAAEVHQRVKLSWVEIKSLNATVCHCCKPSPRHTRVNIMPECWNHTKWSFVETESGELQKVEECEPVDNETSFDDEKPTCCHVYLVPSWYLNG